MPRNNVHPIMESFSDTPLMVASGREDFVSATLNYLTSDAEASKLLNEGMFSGSDMEFWQNDEHPFRPYMISRGVLQVPVQGLLLNKFGYQLGRWATGYDYIEKAIMRGMEDPDVDAIALVINSAGGAVPGCFELVDKIYDLRGTKPIRAFADDNALSAAYAIASAAGGISVTRSGATGSIGVLTSHVDMSEALGDAGIKVTLIHAGKHKVDGNPYEKLPEDVKARIQDRIDGLYGVFTSTVARNRAMDEDAVKATEALIYDAQDSVAQGLADKVGALDEEMVSFEHEVAEAEEETMSYTQQQYDDAVAAAKAEGHKDGVAEGKKTGMEEGRKAEQERVSAILGLEEAAARPAAAQMMVDLGVSADQAKTQLGKLPEEKPEKTTPEGGDQGNGQQGQQPPQGNGQQGQQPPQGNGQQGQSHFASAMDQTKQPQVGPNGGQDDDAEGGDSNESFADGFFGSQGIGKKAAAQ